MSPQPVPAAPPRLSVVIPVLNDAAALARLLEELNAGERPELEVLVVDGGSDDGSLESAHRAGARCLTVPAGRGAQLAAGAEASRGCWLWLLHADSSGVAEALEYLLCRARSDPGCYRRLWGRFDVAFEPASPTLSVVAFAMRWRSRLTGICTGDQGMFVRRDALQRIGGVPAQPLMEDIELSRRLMRLGRPECRSETLTTSSRRWLERGVWRTILGMWRFRLRYWAGADPQRLAREYYR